MKNVTVFSLAILFAASASAADNYIAQIDSILADSALANALVGLAIRDITSDSLLYDLNAGKLFSPASNMKLFTSAAALELLGPGYRFKTRFSHSGEIDKKGRLKGDLIIAGGGDPLISGRFRDSITEVLYLWADSLSSYGIKEIKGDIIVDNSFFAGQRLGFGWSWDDLSYWYACPVTALAFDDNCVDLEFRPGKKVGDKAKITINPETDYIKITNNAVTLPAGSEFTLDYYRTPSTNDVEFFGGIAVDDSGQVDYVSVYRPEIYCAYIFSDVLKAVNIKFEGVIYNLDELKEKERDYIEENIKHLFAWQSDSLGVVVAVINQRSQNLFAELTLLTMGKKIGGEGSFTKSLEVVQAFFDSIGISSDDLDMNDGSGLSYINLVKPDAIIRLLKFMYNSEHFEIYYNSLRTPRDFRLVGVENRENVRVRGGTIANTRTYSGYLTGPASGHLLAFSIMVNNYSCPKKYVESWQDSILEVLLRHF
ncbi:MAG: D-alanyl-D-alanine carboxypeptidase/D-alanyl-D-alanine-endopeptidase [Candidatus Zixiibacteriota bacterium]|nr:MAG: D-alanyl-D-alanine carboxypeptidase/D-alanyl-D-alanine-endopeptidase [candidate division Zixibacteria bacterium]